MRPYLFILTIIFHLAASASLSAAVRIDTDLSYRMLRYSEERDEQSFLNSDFTVTGVAPRLRAEWLVFPTWFSLGGEIEYFQDLSTDSDAGNSFRMFKQSSQAAISFNSRPFIVSLVAEQFYQTFYASDKTFGYDSAQGMQFYPILDFVFPAGSRVFIKYPLLGNLDGKEEIAGGIHLRFSGKGGVKYPGSLYQPSAVLKLEYSQETLKFRENRNVDIEIRSWVIGLGYNF
jgi:hypothetical protein